MSEEIRGPRAVYVGEDEFPGKYDVFGTLHDMTREEMDRRLAEMALAHEAACPAREARQRAAYNCRG